MMPTRTPTLHSPLTQVHPLELNLLYTHAALAGWVWVAQLLPKMSMPGRFSRDLTALYRGNEGLPRWVARIRGMDLIARVLLVGGAAFLLVNLLALLAEVVTEAAGGECVRACV
jgi:hypothetical protein